DRRPARHRTPAHHHDRRLRPETTERPVGHLERQITMTDTHHRTFDRRSVLLAGTGLPLGVLLASCASGGGGSEETEPAAVEDTGPVDPDNPFGLTGESAV